jgi:hypothetical protein
MGVKKNVILNSAFKARVSKGEDGTQISPLSRSRLELVGLRVLGNRLHGLAEDRRPDVE